MKNLTKLTALTLTAALALTACGSGGNDADEPAAAWEILTDEDLADAGEGVHKHVVSHGVGEPDTVRRSEGVAGNQRHARFAEQAGAGGGGVGHFFVIQGGNIREQVERALGFRAYHV